MTFIVYVCTALLPLGVIKDNDKEYVQTRALWECRSPPNSHRNPVDFQNLMEVNFFVQRYISCKILTKIRSAKLWKMFSMLQRWRILQRKSQRRIQMRVIAKIQSVLPCQRISGKIFMKIRSLNSAQRC